MRQKWVIRKGRLVPLTPSKLELPEVMICGHVVLPSWDGLGRAAGGSPPWSAAPRWRGTRCRGRRRPPWPTRTAPTTPARRRQWCTGKPSMTARTLAPRCASGAGHNTHAPLHSRVSHLIFPFQPRSSPYSSNLIFNCIGDSSTYITGEVGRKSTDAMRRYSDGACDWATMHPAAAVFVSTALRGRRDCRAIRTLMAVMPTSLVTDYR